MQYYTVDQMRRGLDQAIIQSLQNHEEAAIVSESGTVILMPQSEFESIQETLNLLRDKRALKALLDGHAQRDAGLVREVPEVESICKVFDRHVSDKTD